MQPDDIERRLGVPISFTVPDDQPLVTHTVNRGVPLILSHKRSTISRAVRKVAMQLIEDFPTRASQMVTSSKPFIKKQRRIKRETPKEERVTDENPSEADYETSEQPKRRGKNKNIRERTWFWQKKNSVDTSAD